MSTPDRYHAALRCPGCSQTGRIHFWEYDGRSFDGMTHVDRIDGEFEAIYFRHARRVPFGRSGSYKIHQVGDYRGVACLRCGTMVHDRVNYPERW